MVEEVASICAGLSPPVQLRVTPEKYLAGMHGSDHKASTLQDLLVPKRLFWRPFLMKQTRPFNLPRQARDKRKKKLRKYGACLRRRAGRLRRTHW
jgi:hypothetical protein